MWRAIKGSYARGNKITCWPREVTFIASKDAEEFIARDSQCNLDCRRFWRSRSWFWHGRPAQMRIGRKSECKSFQQSRLSGIVLTCDDVESRFELQATWFTIALIIPKFES